jgi:hypothetical protein
MFDRCYLVVASALTAAIALPLACAPQVVDAVDTQAEGSGGSGQSGGTGGTAAGSGGTSGATTCPDGGISTDSDGDGVFDCFDGCPDDPNKDRPLLCGCKLPEPEDGGGPSCLDLQPLLAHRYRFDGTGTTVVDSVLGGDADGEVINAELSGRGTLELEGAQSDQYVNLPNGIISNLGSVTLEAWLQWDGGGAWQRIFDFGDSTLGEDAQSGGASYLFLTPRTDDVDPDDPNYNGPYLRATYGRAGGTGVIELRANAELNPMQPRIFPSGRIAHVAATVDGNDGSMHVYIDGVLEAAYESQPPVDLSLVNDVNCWLGKSQFGIDPELNATYYEFRIYDAALTSEQIDMSFVAGPDPPFFP